MISLYKFIASGFGSGYSPFAPGTAGSVLALAIFAYLGFAQPLSNCCGISLTYQLYFLIALSIVLGVLSANKLESLWGHDAQKIVIDEMAGYWIAILWIPFGWLNLLLALILFRVFDIFKPWPVNKAEKWPGGWGVMGDDIVAGIMANLVLQLINFFL